MLKDLMDTFQHRMLELGCTGRRTRRAATELAEHYEDLVQAALEDGMPQSLAEERASRLLGEPRVLAERTAEAVRLGSWCGRHPMVACGVLAPLAFVPALALVCLLCAGVYEVGYLIKGPGIESWLSAGIAKVLVSSSVAFWIQSILEVTLIGSFAVLLGWQTRRSALELRWTALACVMCAVHGWFFRITLSQHFLVLGYAWTPNWYCVIPPLVVAALFAIRQRLLQPRLLPLTLVLALSSISFLGCAAPKPKPDLQRGWIGGEYRTAKKNNIGNMFAHSEADELCLPTELAKERHSAVFVKQVNTNSPVALAGLQPKDFVLAVDNHSVKNLSQFHKSVDRAKPGQELNLTIYRQGETIELPVQVGAEKYKKGGMFTIVFPSVVHGWDLCFHPGLSFVFVGCEPASGVRPELGKEKEVYQEDWKAFAAIFELSSGKRIVSQQLPAH